MMMLKVSDALLLAAALTKAATDAQTAGQDEFDFSAALDSQDDTARAALNAALASAAP